MLVDYSLYEIMIIIMGCVVVIKKSRRVLKFLEWYCILYKGYRENFVIVLGRY